MLLNWLAQTQWGKKFIIKLGILINQANHAIARQTLPKFSNAPVDIEIALPRTILNPDKIALGEGVRLGPGSLLNAITVYPSSWMTHPTLPQVRQTFTPQIIIGQRVTATAGLQVAAHQNITIEDDVLFASNVNITDGLHGYEEPDTPYKYQPIFKVGPILIKRGCWIGQNVVILPGVTIGEQAIIGANSVVTKSIPDRTIAVGSPAKVIKKWSEESQQWQSVSDVEPENSRPESTSLPQQVRHRQ
ncbi:MAG TPA: acyltransferase [Anaerolineae bacterium]|nr:acyltransferase [Anaerolineae bacterium]